MSSLASVVSLSAMMIRCHRHDAREAGGISGAVPVSAPGLRRARSVGGPPLALRTAPPRCGGTSGGSRSLNVSRARTVDSRPHRHRRQCRNRERGFALRGRSIRRFSLLVGAVLQSGIWVYRGCYAT